jgi:hypothetical protein
MSELQRRVHNNMLTFQAAMPGHVVHLRDWGGRDGSETVKFAAERPRV